MDKRIWLVPALAGLALPAAAGERVLRAEMVLDAPVEDVWKAWTTEGGAKTFFAPAAHIEPRVDGLYEIYFDPTAAPGRRGAEGLRILVFEPMKRLSFTWNAPPDQPYVRAQRTVVTLELTPRDAGHTLMTLTHSGWGEGPEWDRAYQYFDDAWNRVVLPRLVYRFTHGPIDWARRPDLPPVKGSLQAERGDPR
jgi:uncharacterized protein YndB with AHSA1/START domain